MNIQIITSSYPSHPADATGTAGLFVRDFALELVRRKHSVVILVAARKDRYVPDPGIIIEPISWRGGDQELASMDLLAPKNWFTVIHFLLTGCTQTVSLTKKYRIDKTLCMWVVPAGIFGWRAKNKTGTPYDVWALGSDIWKIRKLLFGPSILKALIARAKNVYADGVQLSEDVQAISKRKCLFLPSSRILPEVQSNVVPVLPSGLKHFLFVGRYHRNKGPDVLIEAIRLIPADHYSKFRVHMFGIGPMKQALADKISSYGLEAVIDLNDVIDAQSFSNYLAQCQYLVIPSRIESIPIVLSDAVQRGVPVIVSDVGDMGKLVTGHQAGVVVRSDEPADLASAIMASLQSDTMKYAEGVKSLSKVFDIRHTCEMWLSGQ